MAWTRPDLLPLGRKLAWTRTLSSDPILGEVKGVYDQGERSAPRRQLRCARRLERWEQASAVLDVMEVAVEDHQDSQAAVQ